MYDHFEVGDGGTDTSIGQDSSYGIKLAWQHLSWKGPPRVVQLGHDRNGPNITTGCRWFDTDSTDETSLFWKGRNGWRAIKTTPFGLEDASKNLSDYVSRCTAFYLQDHTGDLGYIGQILKAVGTNSRVRKLNRSWV